MMSNYRRVPLNNVEVHTTDDDDKQPYKVVLSCERKQARNLERGIGEIRRDIRDQWSLFGVIRFEKDVYMNGRSDCYASFGLRTEDKAEEGNALEASSSNTVVLDEILFTRSELEAVLNKMRLRRGVDIAKFKIEYFNNGLNNLFTVFKVLAEDAESDDSDTDLDDLLNIFDELQVSRKDDDKATTVFENVNVPNLEKENVVPPEKENTAPVIMTPVSKRTKLQESGNNVLDGYDAEDEDEGIDEEEYIDEDEEGDQLAPLPLTSPVNSNESTPERLDSELSQEVRGHGLYECKFDFLLSCPSDELYEI